MTAIYIYLGCTLFVALRLGFHVLWRLDRFDWRYGDVWANFWFTLLLWPLALVKPRIIISPTFSSQFLGIDLVERERELDRLRNYPPPCGSRIRFVCNQEEGLSNSFTFDRDAVLQALTSGMVNHVPYMTGRHHDILNWINTSSPTSEKVTDVPELWWEFMHVATALLQSGHGTVWCGKCCKNMPANSIRGEAIGLSVPRYYGWLCECGCRLMLVY